MSSDGNRRNGPQFKTAPLVTSAAMVGAGTLIALAGLAVGGGRPAERDAIPAGAIQPGSAIAGAGGHAPRFVRYLMKAWATDGPCRRTRDPARAADGPR